MAKDESDLRAIVRSSGTIAAAKHGQSGVNARTWAFAVPALVVLFVGLGLPLPGFFTPLVLLIAAGVGAASVSYAKTYRDGARSALGSGRGPRQLR